MTFFPLKDVEVIEGKVDKGAKETDSDIMLICSYEKKVLSRDCRITCAASNNIWR